MFIDFLLEVFEKNQSRDAIVWRDNTYSYEWLLVTVQIWANRLEMECIPQGAIVLLEADFSPNSVALMLALVEHRCIVVPLTKSVETKKAELCEIAQVEVVIEINFKDNVVFSRISNYVSHELLHNLKKIGHPGLVLFSSGSTGKSKAAVHDFVPLLEKYMVSHHCLRTVTFLLFDHIGGLNTLFHTLSNAGCIITVSDRSPSGVCSAIEKFKAEVLPTSPTFMNLLLLSGDYIRYDLSSLQLVTYGTEVMAESTLKRFSESFPSVRLLQTYGLSEVGILRSRSKSSESPWLKIGGEGFETRVVDGMLEIKAKSAMLGYLNAPSPFTEDGWLKTGDVVEIDGDYMRILGRNSEIINVGGRKVYPTEVESVLGLMEGVEDVLVSAESSPIMGEIVVARIKVNSQESLADFRRRMRAFCKLQLADYKIPQKVILVDRMMHAGRFKKKRIISDQPP